MKLTRYLYILDEIKYTLITKLCRKDCDIEECLFWGIEIFDSGFKTEFWNIIFEIYYNFYAIYYPKYEKKINNLVKKNNLESALSAIYLLFTTSKHSFQVFNLFIKKPLSINKVYIRHKFPFLNTLNISKKFHNFVLSIHKNNMHNISYYLNTTVAYDDYIDNLYAAIKEYFQKVKNLKLQNKTLNSISYKNKKHILMTLIVYLNENEENINKRKIFRRFDYEKFKPFVDSTRQIITPLYKTLKVTPLYCISSKIGCFPLKRNKYKNIKDEIRYHWEYHSFGTPLWRERFDKYGGYINKNKKQVDFNDDEKREEFYEKYNYEFDEQSIDIQNLIAPEIPQSSFEDWFK
tara:strand:- start:869 stop:1912 length:1044 start_codon:yes stop_codon:yes gene_type:complete